MRDQANLGRSFWLLDRQTIRLLNNDRLLPESMASAAVRQQIVDRLPTFIARGRLEWLKRLELA